MFDRVLGRLREFVGSKFLLRIRARSCQNVWDDKNSNGYQSQIFICFAILSLNFLVKAYCGLIAIITSVGRRVDVIGLY